MTEKYIYIQNTYSNSTKKKKKTNQIEKNI